MYLFILQLHAACAPQQGSNLCPVQWKQAVLTTKPLGKTQFPLDLIRFANGLIYITDFFEKIRFISYPFFLF